MHRRQSLRAAALLAFPFGSRASQPAPVEVAIRGNLFVPEQITVKPGTTVRWNNEERRTSHSVLFTGPDGFESERLLPGESWSRRFDTPGRYPYSCGPHPDMKGLVVVAP